MLDFAEYRELRNVKWYQTLLELIMDDHGRTEENAIGILLENVEREVSEVHTLTQKTIID